MFSKLLANILLYELKNSDSRGWEGAGQVAPRNMEEQGTNAEEINKSSDLQHCDGPGFTVMYP